MRVLGLTESDAKMGDDLAIALSDYSASVEIAPGSRGLSFSVHSWSNRPEARKAGLISYSFYNDADEILTPSEPYANSAQLGPYFYLSRAAEDGVATTRVHLPIPAGAVRCELRGHEWKAGVSTKLYKVPLIRQPGSDLESVFEQVAGHTVPIPITDFVSVRKVGPGSDTVIIKSTFLTNKSDRPARGFLLVELLDADGNAMAPTGDLPINASLGSYIELESMVGETLTDKTVSVRIPTNCVRMRFRGSPRSSRLISLAEPVEIERISIGSDAEGNMRSLTGFLDNVSVVENLIVMYSGSSILDDWSAPSRASELATKFAQEGNWVILFDGGNSAGNPRAITDARIYHLHPRHFRLFMDIGMQRQGRNNKFVCASVPDLNVATSIDRMRDNAWMTVYESNGDIEELSKYGYAQWFNDLLEARVAKRADRVLAVSPRLQEKLSIIGRRSDVHMVPNAVSDDLVVKASYLRHPDALEVRRRSKKVGFIGDHTLPWFDWELLLQLAAKLPWVDFEIIGPELPSGTHIPKNIVYLGDKSHIESIPYAAHWCAGLIPFKISPLTYGMDPHQVYQYAAMGLRTVTIPVGSVESAPGVSVYQNLKGAVDGVTGAIKQDSTLSELGRYEDYSSYGKWSYRATQVLNILEVGYDHQTS